jgi:hypothetical protein
MTALRDLYPMPGIDPHWHVPNEFESVFDWRFDEGRTTLMHLYQKGQGHAVGCGGPHRLGAGSGP